jgi:phenylacetic acid degradation operon negative regulatory protein
MTQKGNGVDEWVRRYLKDEEPRSKSLMISAFGDSIAPYAEGIWLGEFISLLEPLGLNERLVRTSAFRLVEEGWLRARREGRRSHYALTPKGTARFESAYSHIYTAPQRDWDGQWTLVLTPRNGDSSADRMELKRELEWAGFASPTAGLQLHPTVTSDEVRSLVERHGLQDDVVVLRARTAEAPGTDPHGNALLSRGWNLGAAEDRYARFLARFEPLLARLDAGTVTPLQAFLVQTLLIHSYRRASLQDPRLPLPMLPADWVGLRAFGLCREIYTRTCPATLRHLRSLPGLEISDPRGGRLRMSVAERFGGVKLA